MRESRSKKAIFNTITGLLYEGVNLICGLILPRLILSSFGSSYNGVISSITQFISCVSLMKAGIGGVTRAALYKPLAENNIDEINGIIYATQRFMQKIALIFGVAVVGFAILYPIYICDDFSWFFSFTLILIISISTFMQYYFGLTYQMLLAADQSQAIISWVQIFSTILSTILSAVMIKTGQGIHIVKLVSGLVFSVNPLILNIYCKKRYKLKKTKFYRKDLLKQRWDAVGHEIAYFINTNTDVIVLTIFTTLKEVSVYTVYHYVIAAIYKLVTNFVNSFGAAFGDMYARRELSNMHKNLEIFEMIVFSITSIIYSVAAVMITPFVLLYTEGIHDVEYSRILFGVILTLGGMFMCYRIPYYSIITALGHYKQTKKAAFIEAIINIVISVLLVKKIGIEGVAIGTLIAAIFRSYEYARYLGKNILQRSNWKFFKHVIVSLTIYLIVYIIGTNLMGDYVLSVEWWVVHALRITLMAIIITLFFDIFLWRKAFFDLLKKCLNIVKK